jgi:hypothetical protein
MDDAQAYSTTADAERRWKGAEWVSQQSVLGRWIRGTRTAHPHPPCVARHLRAGREPLCGSVISGLSHRWRSKRYAVLVVADRREHSTHSLRDGFLLKACDARQYRPVLDKRVLWNRRAQRPQWQGRRAACYSRIPSRRPTQPMAALRRPGNGTRFLRVVLKA